MNIEIYIKDTDKIIEIRDVIKFKHNCHSKYTNGIYEITYVNYDQTDIDKERIPVDNCFIMSIK